MTGPVVLYTQQGCRFCASAKSLLTRRGVEYEEIDITDDDGGRAGLTMRTGLSTLPQLLVADVLFGGFDELMALDRAGDLQARVTEVLRSSHAGAPT